MPRIADRVSLDLLHEAHDGFLAVHDGLAVVHERQRKKLDLVLGTVGARLAPVVPSKVTQWDEVCPGYLRADLGVKRDER